MGGSAGGALALGLARRAVRNQTYKSSLKGIIALVPVTTHRGNVPSEYKALHDEHYYKEAATAPIIDEESVNMCYAQAGLDMDDSDYFVLLAKEDHASFPPTYILSCECDPLRADSYALKKALEDAGVKVKHDDIPSMPHYYWIFPQLEESKTFGSKLLAGIEWVESQS
jgi:versiconal hemiacetal acetate esterase